MIKTFFLLCVAHYATDYLQTSFTAKYKAPFSIKGWYHVMLGHCALHAVSVVATITYLGYTQEQAILIAACEIVFHFNIDSLKCYNVFGLDIDQLLHLLCKAFYLYLLTAPVSAF